ncbi:MAG: ABC transporter permease [Spirochaetota bacterium]
MSGLPAMMKSDLRSIRRDPMLALMALAPILLGIVLGILLPYVDMMLNRHLDFDLRPQLPFIASLFLLLPPLLAGSIFGLLLIEERDSRVPEALSVTPLGRNGFYLFKFLITLGWAIVCELIFICVNVLVAGSLLFPIELLTSPALLLLIPSAALHGALVLPLLALFAGDRISGMAQLKLFSSVMVLPVFWYLLPQPRPVGLHLLYPVSISSAFLQLEVDQMSAALNALLAIGLESILLILAWTLLTRAKQLPLQLSLRFHKGV